MKKNGNLEIELILTGKTFASLPSVKQSTNKIVVSSQEKTANKSVYEPRRSFQCEQFQKLLNKVYDVFRENTNCLLPLHLDWQNLHWQSDKLDLFRKKRMKNVSYFVKAQTLWRHNWKCSFIDAEIGQAHFATDFSVFALIVLFHFKLLF